MSTTASTDLRRALAIAAPMIGFFLVQNLASLIVLSRIGELGPGALAGVGLANAIFMGLMALLYGVDTAVQAQVARAAGAGAAASSAQAMVDGIAIGAPVGALLAVITAALGPRLLGVVISGAAAQAGSENLRGLALTLLALGVTIPMNAFWIATGRPQVSLAVTIATSVLSVAAAWILTPLFGPAGAGAASSLAAFAGLGLQTALLLWRCGRGWLMRPRGAGVLGLIRIGWPVSLQQAVMQGVLMAAFAIVAQLGVAATAAASVLSSLTLFPIQVCAGAGVATAVLVGQSLGRGAPEEARRWGWRMAGSGAAGMAALGLVAVIAPQRLLSLFIHDPDVVRLAAEPARLLGLMLGVDAMGKILGYGLRGAGATKIATAVPFLFEAVLQLPLLWLIGLKLRFGLTGMFATQFAMVALTAVALAGIWRGVAWTHVRLVGLGETATLPQDARRVIVLGGAGAGKSTLARRLAERLEAPVVHLDRCVFGPHWTPLAAGVQQREVECATRGESWVVEGLYPQLLRSLLPRAQAVIWIDQPVWRRLVPSWRKTELGRRRPRLDRPNGCEEAFGLACLRRIISFGRWTQAVEQALQPEAPNASFIVLRGDAEVEAFWATAPRRGSAETPAAA